MKNCIHWNLSDGMSEEQKLQYEEGKKNLIDSLTKCIEDAASPVVMAFASKSGSLLYLNGNRNRQSDMLLSIILNMDDTIVFKTFIEYLLTHSPSID